MAHFGEILADLRRDKGLQQKELGKELHIAGSTISSYERGINLPNADRIIQIANYFDVTTDYGHLLLEKQAAIFCVISPMNIIMKFFQSQLYAL